MDHTGVTVTWLVNGTTSDNDNITQLGIVTIGAGLQQSNLTIPGYPHLNNTVVTCFAAGFVNDSLYNNFNISTLRIQGNTLSDICHYICFH